MLNFSPIMLFQYAQNSTDCALNYAPNLPIMLKVPIISGRSKRVRSNNCIALLCTASQFHHPSQTRSRCLLGDLYQQTTWTIPWPSCEDSIPGTSTKNAWEEILRDTGTRHSLRTTSLPRTFVIMFKKYLLFLHNAQWFLVPIIPKSMPA